MEDQTEKNNSEFESYRDEIIEMAEADQFERNKMMKGEKSDAESIDQRNTERLREIINKIGWPKKTLVGKEASSAAWLIVQHSDHDIPFQEDCLRAIKELSEGEVKQEEIALLEDRVRINKGQPQLYGTQGLPDENGKLKPFPIEDPEHLEERRQKMGLIPFSAHKEMMEKIYKEWGKTH